MHRVRRLLRYGVMDYIEEAVLDAFLTIVWLAVGYITFDLVWSYSDSWTTGMFLAAIIMWTLRVAWRYFTQRSWDVYSGIPCYIFYEESLRRRVREQGKNLIVAVVVIIVVKNTFGWMIDHVLSQVSDTILILICATPAILWAFWIFSTIRAHKKKPQYDD
jgi:hypothetical protein